ncbi:MAG: hypothetical protein OHK0053_33130 [Microscillaceae bacterium]
MYAGQGNLVLHNPHKQFRQGVLIWRGLKGIALIPDSGGDTLFSGHFVPVAKLSLQGREGYWHHIATAIQIPPQSTQSFKVWLINDQKAPGSFQFFSENAWKRQRFWQNIFPGAYTSLMLVFFVGSLLFYSNNQDKAFLYLSLNTLLLGLFPLFLYGHTVHYTGAHYLDYLCAFSLSQIATLFEIGLIRCSLHTYRPPYRLYDRMLLFFATLRILTLVAGLLIFMFGYHLDLTRRLATTMNLLTLPVGLWIITYFARKGNSLARFFVVGELIVMGGLCLNTLAVLNLLKVSSSIFFLEVAFFLRSMVFSYGMTYRIQRNLQKQQKSQKEVLILQKQLTSDLELQVKIRTQSLEKATEEILSQTEELQQQKEEILALNQHLEKMVKARTAQMNQQNERLREYASLNAHKVRGPLARILGLIYILQNQPPETQDEAQILLQSIALCVQQLEETIAQLQARMQENGEFI